MASRVGGVAAATRFRSAVRKLSKDGVDALRPQKILAAATAPEDGGTIQQRAATIKENGRLWKKPAISKRVARVLRKDSIRRGTYGQFDAETGIGWDPSWDEALFSYSNKSANPSSSSSSQQQQGRYRITKPKLTKRERTREQRAQKIDKNMVGMDERIEQYYVQKQEKKPPRTFENTYKELMKVNKK